MPSDFVPPPMRMRSFYEVTCACGEVLRSETGEFENCAKCGRQIVVLLS